MSVLIKLTNNMKKNYLQAFSLFSFLFLLLSCSTAQKVIEQPVAPKNITKISAAMDAPGISTKRLALLDEHIDKYIKDGLMPGGTFLIARKGKTVYHKSFGHQDDAKAKAYQNDDIYRLASMTKAVTTISIMQLYEQGKLGLDDPIHNYIPAFKESKVLDTFNPADSSYTTVPAKRPITIRHLLTHTSGITYGLFNPGKIQMIYEKLGANGFGLFHDEMTTEQMANKLGTLPLIFQPGEKYLYGLNMELLGRIVEVVSGKPLNKYFRDHIFDPLEMNDTYFNLPQDRHSRLVPFYIYDQSGKLVNATTEMMGGMNVDYPKKKDNNHYAGGGGLSGTATDYAKMIQALCDGGTYKGQRILGRKAIEVMTSDQLPLVNLKGTGYSPLPGITYGLGFALKTEAGSAWSAKSPGTYEWGGAFNTKFFIDPSEELIFVGMGQVFGYRRPDFWERLYTIIYGSLE